MKTIRAIAIIAALVLCKPAAAGQADYFNLYNVPNGQFNFGTWSIGMGDQAMIALFCVASANYNNAYNDPPPVVDPPAQHFPYDIKVATRNADPGYYMYLNNDDSNTGNARLTVTFEHRDMLEGTGWETLIHDTYVSHAHDGQFKRCKNGKNSQLRISIPQLQLQNARAGAYRGRWTATGIGGSSGTVVDSDNFRSDLVVSDIVRVSGLTDIAFGVHVPGADQVGERTFCVYANNDSALYNVTISSPNQDGGGNFFLKSPDDTIPYSLYFKDNTSAGFGTAVGTAAINGNGNNSANDCGSVHNAKISVSVADADIVPSKTGNYSDTLTILVAPN